MYLSQIYRTVNRLLWTMDSLVTDSRKKHVDSAIEKVHHVGGKKLLNNP